MEVYLLPALKDNYIFLLHDRASNTAAVVDPAESAPVLTKLRELKADLVAIFNTHHHHDHIGANLELLRLFPNLTIYGGELDRGRIPGQQVFLKGGDRVNFADQTADVLFLPGHTYAHIAYYFDETADLFCGDTLFAGSCGRLFEGTPAQMLASLQQLSSLPDQTKIWCAHEYTLNNLKFALTVDPNNPILQARMLAVKIARADDQPTIPSNIGLEKQTNPFLRCDRPELQATTGYTDPLKVFTKLRGMKDLF